MTEWVTVNGGRIERSFLQENVSEARTYAWEKGRLEVSEDHSHCIVCYVALSGNDECFCSEGGVLCLYCFGKFVKSKEG